MAIISVAAKPVWPDVGVRIAGREGGEFFFGGGLTKWTHNVYNMDTMIEQVNTAKLKQQLCHYLGMARQGKEVLITSHKRIVARLLGEEGSSGRLPLREPTRSVSVLKDIGGFGIVDDPIKGIEKERGAR